MLNDSETEKRLTHVEERAAKKKPKKEVTPERKAAQAKWVADKRAAAKAAKGEKPAKKGKAAKASKPEKVEPKKTGKMRSIVEAIRAGDLDALDAVSRIDKRWRAVGQAEGTVSNQAKANKERLLAARAEHTEAASMGYAKGDTDAMAKKLVRLDRAWADLQETIALNAREMKDAKEALAKSRKLHIKAHAEIDQLRLAHVPE